MKLKNANHTGLLLPTTQPLPLSDTYGGKVHSNNT